MPKDAKRVTPEELANILKTTYKFDENDIDDAIVKLKSGYILGYNDKHFVLEEENPMPPAVTVIQKKKKTGASKTSVGRNGAGAPSKAKK